MLKTNKILNLVTNFLVPYVIVYAFYIQANGETSPGGGFQAGAIFASCIVAIDLVSEKEILRNLTDTNYLIKISNLGIAIYALVGLICLILGANYLDYYALHLNAQTAQKIGIFSIEIGVGLCVASTLCLIYFEFSKL